MTKLRGAARDSGLPSRWLRIGIPVLLVLVWLVGGSVGGPYFGKVDEVSTTNQSSFLPESAEATQVSELLPKFLGEDSVPAVVVVTGSGELSQDEFAEIESALTAVSEVSGVSGDISPPLISDDGEAVQAFVPVGSDHVADTVERIREALAADLGEGLTAYVTGPAGFIGDLAAGFRGIDGLLLAVALMAVFIILVIVYRSPLLPILVLLTSTFALCVALFTVWWLAKAEIVVLNGQVQGILFILVIGAATDYALLYVARFREVVASGVLRWQATVGAGRVAFEPIIASGGTVIAGLLCLLLSDLASNRALGPIASIGIVFSVLAALTFLPALLAIFGRAAFWPFIPKRAVPIPTDFLNESVSGVWARQARFVARHTRAVWIVSTVVLLAASVGLTQLKADGVATSDLVLGASEARDGQDVLGEHFPAGSGSPMYIVVPEDEVTEAVAVLDELSGVDSLAVAVEDSVAGQAAVDYTDGAVSYTGFGPPGTPEPVPTTVDSDILLIATLTDAADSAAAEDTVRQARSDLHDSAPGALVGGTTATDVDTNDTAIRDRTVIIPVILLVIFVILTLLLRAALAPLLLIASVIVSFAAALGVSAVVFKTLFGFPGADPSVPLYGFVFLVALGVDYNIFLMSRVREEALVFGTRTGVLRGLVATGGVITSAGLVLAATFAALGVIPILFLAQIAFIVGFGVLLDTFVVRSLLVPALSVDIGRAIWWPSRLSRVSENQDASAPVRHEGSGPLRHGIPGAEHTVASPEAEVADAETAPQASGSATEVVTESGEPMTRAEYRRSLEG